jgi:hypothetical protein
MNSGALYEQQMRALFFFGGGGEHRRNFKINLEENSLI